MKSFAYALIPLVVAAWEEEPAKTEVVHVLTSVEGSANDADAKVKVSHEAASADKEAAVEKKNKHTWAAQKSSSDFDSRWGKSYDSVNAKSWDNEFFTRKSRADDDEWAVKGGESVSADKDIANEAVSYDAKEEGIKKLVGYQPVKEGGFGFGELVKHYTPEPKKKTVVQKPSMSFPSFSKGYGISTGKGGYGNQAYSQGYGGSQAYGYGNQLFGGYGGRSHGGYGVQNAIYGYGNQGSYGRSYGNQGYGGRGISGYGVQNAIYGGSRGYGGYGGSRGYTGGSRGYGGYGGYSGSRGYTGGSRGYGGYGGYNSGSRGFSTGSRGSYGGSSYQQQPQGGSFWSQYGRYAGNGYQQRQPSYGNRAW